MSPSYLWVDREERSYPGGSFPLVNVPPDRPGDQVVDQEGHQEGGRENWMGVVVETCAIFHTIDFVTAPVYFICPVPFSNISCAVGVIWIQATLAFFCKRPQFTFFITVCMGASADVKLDDAAQVGGHVGSWQGDIEDGQEDGLLHLLEPCQHFPSCLILKSIYEQVSLHVLIARILGRV